MPKRILDVGNCGPDHAAICDMLTRWFDAELVRAHGSEDTLRALRDQAFDLVLVNRKLDRDYSDGLDVIRQIKSDPQLANVPVMLISNYDEHQQAAVTAGAVRGFGKLQLDSDETRERLAAVLGG